MPGVGEDGQSVGIIRHIPVKGPSRDLVIAEFVHDGPDDLRLQHVLLMAARPVVLQVQPAEQLLFLGRELHKAHAVAAVPTIAPLMRPQRFPYPPGMLLDGPLGQRGLQLLHITEGQIDGLGGAPQRLRHTAGVDGLKPADTEHRRCGVDDGLFGYSFCCRHYAHLNNHYMLSITICYYMPLCGLRQAQKTAPRTHGRGAVILLIRFVQQYRHAEAPVFRQCPQA